MGTEFAIFCLHFPMCTNIQLLNSAIQHIFQNPLLKGIMEPMVYFQRVMALHLLINYCSSFHRKVVSQGVTVVLSLPEFYLKKHHKQLMIS